MFLSAAEGIKNSSWSGGDALPSDSGACLYFKGSPGRQEVEHYILEKYRQVHNAHVSEYLPLLVCIDKCDTPIGAFGLRPGHCRPMFLEQYLNSQIEQQVAVIARQPVDRCSLIEIGNLVVTRNGYGPLLMVVLALSLAQAGYDWMVFTATEQVERLMKRLGFKPHCLAAANPERLTGDLSLWGRYYDSSPKVMAGSLSNAVATVNNSRSLSCIAQQQQINIESIAGSLNDYPRLGKDE